MRFLVFWVCLEVLAPGSQSLNPCSLRKSLEYQLCYVLVRVKA
ncbi:hypothetical protein ACB098_05G102400 [Castanea mollissima]